MTTALEHHPSRRETLAELLTRLQRVEAAAGVLRSLAGGHESSATALTEALQALERDLSLALRQSEVARAHLRI